MNTQRLAVAASAQRAARRKWAALIVCAVGWLLGFAMPARAGNDAWKNPAHGVWQTGSNWVDGSSPMGADAASFNLQGTYTVTFNGTPSAIQQLNLSTSLVTFTSIGFLAGEVSTLRVNAPGGSQSVGLTNFARLTLGTPGFMGLPSRVLHLTIGGGVQLDYASILNIYYGSDVATINVTGDNGGTINVSGSGSTLYVTSLLAGNSVGRIDLHTGGKLNVSAGGHVHSRSGWLGGGGSGIGTASVTGAGSRWDVSDTLSLGLASQGILNVTAGGTVTSRDGLLGANSLTIGTANIDGGTWSMAGRLSVGGNAETGTNGGTGTLTISPGATVAAELGVVLFPDGVVRLQGGTLDTSAITFQGGGQFDWTAGTLHVGTYQGNLTNQGGTLAPGHSPGLTTINGNYTQHAAAALEIEIGGTGAITQHDFLDINGTAFLGGALKLALINGFTPSPSNVFTLMDANSVFGSFNNIDNGQRLNTTNGLGSFLVHYGPTSPFNPNQIILSAYLASPALPGDTDMDGDIDDTDLGTSFANYTGPVGASGAKTWMHGDTDGDGDVDDIDLGTSFAGYTGPLAPIPGANVPEPASVALLVLGVAAVSRRLR